MSKELFLLSSNKARQCKLELITRLLRWGSKISFYRTTELSVPKSRQVIAHAPPRLLLLKWKFPKLCMHIHTAPGADVPWRGRGDGHKATAAASLLQLMSCSPHKAGCLGLQHSMSLPHLEGSMSAQPPSSTQPLGGWQVQQPRVGCAPQGCTPRTPHPIWVRFCSSSSDPA